MQSGADIEDVSWKSIRKRCDLHFNQMQSYMRIKMIPKCNNINFVVGIARWVYKV